MIVRLAVWLLACLVVRVWAVAGPDRVEVVWFETGTQDKAASVGNELEQMGLTAWYDHGRTLYQIEAAMRPTESLRVSSMRFRSMRNMTGHEPGVPYASNRHVAGWLPLDKGIYHRNAKSNQIEHILRAIARTYPRQAAVRVLGQSTRGGTAWAIRVAGNVHAPEGRNPAVLFTGSMHGDDLVGREMCLWLAEYLCYSYVRLTPVRRLLDQMDLYLVPDPSPDAALDGTRYTSRGIDMDRAFPDRIEPRGDPAIPEPEVEAFMAWAVKRRFLASASFLGGGGGPGPEGLVVRYPWNAGTRGRAVPERTADDRAFRYLARSYVRTHPVLSLAGANPDGGATNGAEWYERHGSFQDWIYRFASTLHLDLVVSRFLEPLPQNLAALWDTNLESTMALLRLLSEQGLRGTVKDQETGAGVPGASIQIRDLNDRGLRLARVTTADHDMAEDRDGRFAKFLVPGRYAVSAQAPGYRSSPEVVVVIDAAHRMVTLNLQLVSAQSGVRLH